MKKYFYMSPGETGKSNPGAFTPEQYRSPENIYPLLEGKSELPFEFELKKVSEGNNGIVVSSDLTGLSGIWWDYLPNNIVWPIFSESLKSVIDNSLSGKEGVNWIAAKVKGLDEYRTYYILRFSKMLDVLDEEKTLYASGTDFVVRPCFSYSKIKEFAIFPKPSTIRQITSNIYISEDLRKRIKKSGISRIEYSGARVSQ